jgi:hypothetical protein
MSIPDEFICPISLEIMKDPVICEDGNSYERKFILDWLARSKTSPITRDPLSSERIFPNESLKAAIDNWKSEKNKKKSNNKTVKSVKPTTPKTNIQSYHRPEYTEHVIIISNEPLLNNTNNNEIVIVRDCARCLINYRKILIFTCSLSFGMLMIILLYLYITS